MYKWDEKTALVQTVDFFTPVVDDPATFGAIAAANALSDVYAMGGRPLTALAVAGFPKTDVSPETIREIFMGGYLTLQQAGVALLGGHTVQDKEIKFGYAVTGVVDPARVWSNAGAKAGDILFLTKPIGTGVIATAIKFERAEAASVDAAIESMVTLNRAAAEALMTLPPGAVHACTDITGFGLAGHATEMALASGVTLEIRVTALPLLPGAATLALENRSGGLKTNQQHFAPNVEVRPDVPPELQALAFDPQTSGGLLVAIEPSKAAEAERAFASAGVPATRVGEAGAAVLSLALRLVV